MPIRHKKHLNGQINSGPDAHSAPIRRPAGYMVDTLITLFGYATYSHGTPLRRPPLRYRPALFSRFLEKRSLFFEAIKEAPTLFSGSPKLGQIMQVGDIKRVSKWEGGQPENPANTGAIFGIPLRNLPGGSNFQIS